MTVSLEAVVKQLEGSGIIAPGKLEKFIPPQAHPKSVEELIRELVKQKHLTKFQAQQVALGKVRALLMGGYTILDKIGAGGMGQVFKAVHRRMERVVAIKMLPAAVNKDAAAVARFDREVKAAAKLNHPHIVAAYDADAANGAHFLVMEYVEGKDLSALVKQHGPLPVAKALQYLLQAARGLEFSHRKGVVHRDIKPANLLVDAEGTVKILDMGLARIETVGDAATQAELTGSGAVMGTIDYMAPEQALSTKESMHGRTSTVSAARFITCSWADALTMGIRCWQKCSLIAKRRSRSLGMLRRALIPLRRRCSRKWWRRMWRTATSRRATSSPIWNGRLPACLVSAIFLHRRKRATRG